MNIKDTVNRLLDLWLKGKITKIELVEAFSDLISKGEVKND